MGGWVSTNYAVLACTQFPTCQDSWWPPMNFAQGFEIWRHLGVTGDGQPLDFSALTAIHYAHRLMAYVVFVALGVLAWRMRRIDRCARRRTGSPAWRCCSWPPAWATCCSAGRWPRPCCTPAAPRRWPWC
jgi:heme A synthase